MANYQSLKAAINAVIKANGNKEITGTVLNEVLLAMVNSLGAGYQFAGVATPSTNPGTPDQKVFYIASQAGTYTNFNGAVVSDGVAIFEWNGTWTTETLDLSMAGQVQSDWTETDTTKKSYIKHKPNIPPSSNVDTVPTEDSPNAVSSGGTYDMIVNTAATLFGDIQDATNVDAIESVDGKIYNDYQAGDIFFIVDNNVRKYRVALVAGTADAEHPVTISPVNFYYALNSADAINLSLTLKTVSTEQQSLSTQQKAQARSNIAAVSYDVQTLNATEKVQAQNNVFGNAYSSTASDHSGLGKVYLDKNNGVLTQAMMQATNTVYVIRYDYTMSGNITVPAGCTLEFDGGSISGDGTNKNTLVVDKIESDKPCFQNCLVQTSTYYTHWFKNYFVESIRSINHSVVIYQDTDIEINTTTGSLILPADSVYYGDKKYKVQCNGVTDGIHMGDGCSVYDTLFKGQGSEQDIEETYAPYAMACSSSNVTISGCEFRNFFSDACFPIHFRRGRTCSNITIKDCLFDTFGAKPNGITGDTSGACRGINIQGDYSDIHIYNNVFRNIKGMEDSDYICINKESTIDAEHPYHESINAVIEDNTFYSLNQSAIKIFGSDVLISNNNIISTYSERGSIRGYNCQNVTLDGNYIKGEFTGIISFDTCNSVVVSGLIASVNYKGTGGGHNIIFTACSNVVMRNCDITAKNTGNYTYDKTAFMNLSGYVGEIYIDTSRFDIDDMNYGFIAYTNNVNNLVLNINNSNIKLGTINTFNIDLYGGDNAAQLMVNNSKIIANTNKNCRISKLDCINSCLQTYLTVYDDARLINSKITRVASNGTFYANNIQFDDIEPSNKLELRGESELYNVNYNGFVGDEPARLLDLRYLDTTKNVTIGNILCKNVRYKSIDYVVVNGTNLDRVKYMPFLDTDGFSRGTSRPANPVLGQEFFEMQNKKPIYYSGDTSDGKSGWVDATGADVPVPQN